MRIVVAHTFYREAGGEDQVFAAERSLLEANGHSVEAFTLHNEAVNEMGRASLAVATFWNRSSYRSLLEVFQRFRPEVVHVHNTLPLISPAIYYAAEKAGVAVVQTLHNFRFACPAGTLFRDGRPCEDCLETPFAWRGISRACYRNSRAATAVGAASTAIHRAVGTYANKVDRYIALTEFAAEKARRGGLPADKIRVKPNFLPRDPGVGDGDGRYALFVGRLSPEKGVDVLLDAFRQETGFPLKVIGTGPEEGKVAAAARDRPWIEFLGPQPRDEVLRMMKGAALLVFPSVSYETFGLAAVEAFACGLPVIASNIGAPGEIVMHRTTGLHFRAGDAGDLARQLSWARENPAEIARMRRNARREYEEKYTAERNYERLMEIYHQASDRKKADGAKRR